jgi:hypothetical protein
MQVDMQVTIPLAVITGRALTTTLINEHLRDADEKAELMRISLAIVFVFKNRTVHLRTDADKLVEKAKAEYKKMWFDGKLQLKSGDNRFNPDDWAVEDVQLINVDYAAFPI